jgi:hypothetical protein
LGSGIDAAIAVLGNRHLGSKPMRLTSPNRWSTSQRCNWPSTCWAVGAAAVVCVLACVIDVSSALAGVDDGAVTELLPPAAVVLVDPLSGRLSVPR